MDIFDGFRTTFVVESSHLNHRLRLSEGLAGALAAKFARNAGIMLGSSFRLYLEFSDIDPLGVELYFGEDRQNEPLVWGFFDKNETSYCRINYNDFQIPVQRHLPTWSIISKGDWYCPAPWLSKHSTLAYQTILWALDMAMSSAGKFDIQQNRNLVRHEGILSRSQELDYFCRSVRVEVNSIPVEEDSSARRYWGRQALSWVLRVDSSGECRNKVLRRYQVSFFEGQRVFANLSFDLLRLLQWPDGTESTPVDLDLKQCDVYF